LQFRVLLSPTAHPAAPQIFHQDECYYAMGKGSSIGKRALYAASRILITPDYPGRNSFNASEL
jgi:hypothetical protein